MTVHALDRRLGVGGLFFLVATLAPGVERGLGVGGLTLRGGLVAVVAGNDGLGRFGILVMAGLALDLLIHGVLLVRENDRRHLVFDLVQGHGVRSRGRQGQAHGHQQGQPDSPCPPFPVFHSITSLIASAMTSDVISPFYLIQARVRLAASGYPVKFIPPSGSTYSG